MLKDRDLPVVDRKILSVLELEKQVKTDPLKLRKQLIAIERQSRQEDFPSSPLVGQLLPSVIEHYYLSEGDDVVTGADEETKQFFVDLFTHQLNNYISEIIEQVTNSITKLYLENLDTNTVDLRDGLIEFIQEVDFIPAGQVKPTLDYLTDALNQEINRLEKAGDEAQEDSLVGGVSENLLTITTYVGQQVAFTYEQMTPASVVVGVFSALDKLETMIAESIDDDDLKSSVKLLIQQAKASFKAEEPVGFRERPKFTGVSAMLDEKLQQVWEKQPTAKVWLWQSASEARERLQDKNVSLESWLNLSQPAEVMSAFSTINFDSFNPKSLQTIDQYLLRFTGLRLVDLVENNQLVGVLSDEVLRSLSQTVADLEVSAQKTLSSLEAIIKDLEESSSQLASGKVRKPHKLVKAKFSQVRRYLAKFGLSLPPDLQNKISVLIAYLKIPEVQSKVQQHIDKNQEQINTDIKKLQQHFNLEQFSKQSSIGYFTSRTRSDQYLGDKTKDCTAYKLETGMNAWTVPVWLANPGFNFYLVPSEEGELLAKFGIFLAETDKGELEVVIDSAEVAGNLTKLSLAEVSPDVQLRITQALKQLQTWAQDRGFGRIRLTDVSNSGWLTDLLDTLQDDRDDQVKHHLFDGVNSLREVASLSADDKVDIHLQSSSNENNRQILWSALEHDALLPFFRQILSEGYLKSQDLEMFQGKLRTEGWDTAFSWLMESFFPDVVAYTGKSWRPFTMLVDEFMDSRDSRKKRELAGDNPFWLWVAENYFSVDNTDLSSLLFEFLKEEADAEIDLADSLWDNPAMDEAVYAEDVFDMSGKVDYSVIDGYEDLDPNTEKMLDVINDFLDSVSRVGSMIHDPDLNLSDITIEQLMEQAMIDLYQPKQETKLRSDLAFLKDL